MRVPAGLQDAGRKLWRSTVAVFDFEDEPHKVLVLREACRVTDVIAELDEASDMAPLTVKGSMGQQVISPYIAEARAQRALLANLLSRLDLPPTDDEIAEKTARLTRTRAAARRGNKPTRE